MPCPFARFVLGPFPCCGPSHCIERLWRTCQLVWRPRVLNLVQDVLNLVLCVLNLVLANLKSVRRCTKFSTPTMPDCHRNWPSSCPIGLRNRPSSCPICLRNRPSSCPICLRNRPSSCPIGQRCSPRVLKSVRDVLKSANCAKKCKSCTLFSTLVFSRCCRSDILY